MDWAVTLRERGLRATGARVHVLESLSSLEHGTPEEIYEAARHRSPGLNLSTVYRTLDVLGEQGLVSHTHLDHPSATYMLAGHADHAHLVCRGCHQVTVLEAGVGRSVAASVQEAHGFEVDTGHLSIFGLCAGCRRAAAG